MELSQETNQTAPTTLDLRADILNFFKSDLVFKQKYPTSMDKGSIWLNEYSTCSYVRPEDRRLLTIDQVMSLQTTRQETKHLGSTERTYFQEREARVYKAWRLWCLTTIAVKYADQAVSRSESPDLFVDHYAQPAFPTIATKDFEKQFTKAWAKIRNQSKYSKLRKEYRETQKSIFDFLPEQETFDPSITMYKPGFYDYAIEEERDESVEILRMKMVEAVKFLDFEVAAKLRDQILAKEEL